MDYSLMLAFDEVCLYYHKSWIFTNFVESERACGRNYRRG